MHERPKRLDRLPEQYFTALLARVAAAAAQEGEPLVDLGRGNPEVGPPEHVVRDEQDPHRAGPLRPERRQRPEDVRVARGE